MENTQNGREHERARDVHAHVNAHTVPRTFTLLHGVPCHPSLTPGYACVRACAATGPYVEDTSAAPPLPPEPSNTSVNAKTTSLEAKLGSSSPEARLLLSCVGLSHRLRACSVVMHHASRNLYARPLCSTCYDERECCDARSACCGARKCHFFKMQTLPRYPYRTRGSTMRHGTWTESTPRFRITLKSARSFWVSCEVSRTGRKRFCR